MNKRQKLVQQQFLDNEEGIIKRLAQVHTQSLKDITAKIEKLQEEFDELTAMYDTVEDEAQREVLKSMQRSKVYQKKYQEGLKKQVGDVLDNLHKKEFKSISEYLDGCYTDGFIGAMYDLQGQGLPFIFPIDQEAMVRAVQLDSKISKGLYKHLGENFDMLKKHITAQVSRGISTGMTFERIAQQLSAKMVGTYNNPGGSLAYASRIARTEGHRIQVQSGMDACYKAKEKGADVVKQWDSTLDSKTRKSHKRVDGEIRELDEEFSNGLMFPGDPDGKAEEVIHCRCALLQRARAALDESELETLKERAAYYGLDKTDNFNDFKKKYLKAAESETVKIETTSKFIPAKTVEEAQQYSQKFVSEYKSKYSGNVDFGKCDVSTINAANETIGAFYDAYDVPPLRNIQVMNMREKRWREAKAEAAYGWGSGDLYINGNYYKDAKAMAAHRKEYEELMERVMPKVPGAIAELEGKTDFLSRRKHRYYSALLETGRTNVYGVEVEGSIIHEMGHMLDDTIFGFQKTQSKFDIKASMEKYASKISAYATSDSREYIAESFSAYWKGETDIIDPELLKIFESHRKTTAQKEKIVKTLAKSPKSGIMDAETSLKTIMPDNKFIKYALDPKAAPDKAKAFKSALGYDKENFEELKDKIDKKIDESKFVQKGDVGYGMTFEYVINIEGANGKKANVLTAWIQDGEDKRLTSVYVTKKKVTE